MVNKGWKGESKRHSIAAKKGKSDAKKINNKNFNRLLRKTVGFTDKNRKEILISTDLVNKTGRIVSSFSEIQDMTRGEFDYFVNELKKEKNRYLISSDYNEGLIEFEAERF